MRLHFVLAPLAQDLSSLFCIRNPSHHFFAVRHLRSRPIVFWPYSLQLALYLMPVIRPIVVLFVQDQPDLKAWIRSSNSYAVGLANVDRFFISFVFVSIEYSPNLVLFFKQIPSPSCTSYQSLRFGEL